MKGPAIILCMIAAVITLIFAVQFISFYLSPPDLSTPAGLDEVTQSYWDTHIAVITPDTYLAIGLIGLLSVIAGMIGGVMQFFDKRLPLAGGLMIAAAGLSYFINLAPVSFLYLAAAVCTLRDPEKAAKGLAALSLGFILVTYVFQWATGLFLNGTFLSWVRFSDVIYLASLTMSGSIYSLGTLVGVILIGAASIMLYRRQQTIPATALAVTAVGFIILLVTYVFSRTPDATNAANAANATNASNAANANAVILVPFVLLAFALIVLAVKFLKGRKAGLKGI